MRSQLCLYCEPQAHNSGQHGQGSAVGTKQKAAGKSRQLQMLHSSRTDRRQELLIHSIRNKLTRGSRMAVGITAAVFC
jgi:hypothetical protein